MTHHPGVVEINRTSSAAVLARSGCPVYLGTSGYSYTEWVDSGFYPAGTKTADMLPLYARCFSIVELNYTWYQMARAEAVARMAAKAPAHFRFAAKLTRTLTHEREENWREQLQLLSNIFSPTTPTTEDNSKVWSRIWPGRQAGNYALEGR